MFAYGTTNHAIAVQAGHWQLDVDTCYCPTTGWICSGHLFVAGKLGMLVRIDAVHCFDECPAPCGRRSQFRGTQKGPRALWGGEKIRIRFGCMKTLKRLQLGAIEIDRLGGRVRPPSIATWRIRTLIPNFDRTDFTQSWILNVVTYTIRQPPRFSLDRIK